MRRRSNGLNARMAAIVSSIVIVLALYGAFVQRVPFSERYEVSGMFSSSQGIIEGAPVRIAGVNVGIVTAVERGPGDTAEITFELEEDYREVRTDATMRLRPRIFLEGGFYVELHPGTPSAPVLAEDAVVGLPQTSVAVQADQIQSNLDSTTRESLRTILDEVSKGLGGGGAQDLRGLTEELAPMLRDGALAAEAARGRRPGDLRRLIVNAGELTSTLERQGDRLGGLIEGGERTTRAFAQNSLALRETLRLSEAVLSEAPGTLDAVDRALPPTDEFLSALRPALDQLPESLSRTGRVLDELSKVSRGDRLPRLLAILDPAVRDLPQLERRLVPLFDLVGPVSRCVAEHTLATLKTPVDDGPGSTGRPVWQDLTNGVVGSAGAHSSFDGNGHWERFQGGLSDRVVSTGDVPGIGTLVGTTELPLLGTRPRWQGPTTAQFRPDVDCESQPHVDLRAEVGPVERTFAAPEVAAPTARERLRLLRDLGASELEGGR